MLNQKLYTVKEVAEMIKVKPLTIYRMIESGKLKALQVGTITRIAESDLMSIIKRKE